MLIVPAATEDAPELAALRYEFRASASPPVESREAFVLRCRQWMEERLSDSSSGWRCWVARDQEGLVGHVWLYALEKIPNPVAELETHGYISNLYVRPRSRNAGIGGCLLGQALTWCRANRVDQVILWPTPESRSLYARHGFAIENQLMALSSGPEGESA